MFVRTLTLHNFRSWRDLELDLEPGVSVFFGANGNGKTNIVEALGYLAHLRSHRVSHDSALVREGEDLALLSATAVNDGRELTAHLAMRAKGANKAHINRAAMPNQQDLLGIVRTTMFSPEDLALVRGEPDNRRVFLDTIMVARYPRLAGVKAEYDKILRQRNALLRNNAYALRSAIYGGGELTDDAESALTTLDIWDQQLAHHGGQIMSARVQLVHDLMPHLYETYQCLAPESRPAHGFYTSTIDELLAAAGVHLGESTPGEETALLSPELATETLLQGFHNRRTAEIERGTTLLGPHRDDLILMLGTQPAKGFASHGESWSFALALRLAAFFMLRGAGAEPVVILDDVFAELDADRRQHLVSLLSEAEQVLITAAVEDDIPPELREIARFYPIGARATEEGKESFLTEEFNGNEVGDREVTNQEADGE